MADQQQPQKAAAPRRPFRVFTAANGQRFALYDFAQERNAEGGRLRRLSRIEFEGEDEILRPDLRNRAVNLARDMARNNPQFRGLHRTMRINTVGDLGKLRFNAAGDWYDAAQRWFNVTWAAHADFVDGSTWRECLQLAIVAIEAEGDFVVVFDDGILTPTATGKLRFFEADQICNLDEGGFAEFAAKGWRQQSGIIYDEHGRMTGVVVTGKRGLTCVSRDEAFVLLRDPDDRADPAWQLVRRKFRLCQGRGSAAAIPALQTVIDGYEMAGLEMLTAKQGAARYALVTMPQDTPTGLNLPGGIVPDTAAGDGDASAPASNAGDYHADGLEYFTGGNTDYAPYGTDIKFDPANRPNANVPAFLDWSSDLAGAAFGFGHAYSRLRADSSYTAFRGDMVLTWGAFRDNQQFLEDAFSDWVARRAIRHGMMRGEITGDAPEGWEHNIAWQYPRMPAVDEAREQNATAQKLKNGLTTYRELLGPAWREQLDQLADEIAYIRSKGLPLSVLETVSGEVVPADEGEQ